MKKISFFHSLMAAMMLAVAFTSCSKDDDEKKTPEPEPEPTPEVTYHYDLTVTVGKHGGMAKSETHLTMGLAELNDPQKTVDFKGNGVEISDYTIENIYDNKYMYQVPASDDRFTKLQLKDNKLTVVQEQKFKENTYKSRNYTHAWIDKTLVIMSTDGDHQKVIWTKLNSDDMSIISEGTLSITALEDNVLTTSGILTYRKSDNKLFYFYYNKPSTSGSDKTTTDDFFRIAVINPQTMAVEKEIINKEAAQPQGSAYGELLQSIVFFDEQDNLYLSAFNVVSKKNYGRLLRIKKGEYDFEAGYNAFPDAKGKLLTVQYLGSGKVLAYAGDNAVGSKIQDAAYYYSIIDLNTKTVTPLSYNGVELPYSAGSFSQRSVYNPKENKAYFGVSNADEECVYIYDVATGTVTKGLTIAAGYYFDQIRLFED